MGYLLRDINDAQPLGIIVIAEAKAGHLSCHVDGLRRRGGWRGALAF